MATKKEGTAKLSGAEQVDRFLNGLDHPLKEAVQEVRRIILRAEPQLTEHIKWNAPSFCWNGQDRVTFNLHGETYFRLVFHCGARVKEVKTNGMLFDDSTGLLEWAANDRATAKFTDLRDVREKEASLREVVSQWIAAAG